MTFDHYMFTKTPRSEALLAPVQNTDYMPVESFYVYNLTPYYTDYVPEGIMTTCDNCGKCMVLDDISSEEVSQDKSVYTEKYVCPHCGNVQEFNLLD